MSKHDDDVATGHLEVKVLHDPHPRAAVPVGRKGEEVELAGPGSSRTRSARKQMLPFNSATSTTPSG